MTTYTSLPAFLTDIADAIRDRTGLTTSIAASNFPSYIGAIPKIKAALGSKTVSDATRTFTMSGLPAEPVLFFLYRTSNISGTSARVACVFYERSQGTLCGYYSSTTSSGKIVYSASNYSWSYSSGTLTISSTTPYFEDTYNAIAIFQA